MNEKLKSVASRASWFSAWVATVVCAFGIGNGWFHATVGHLERKNFDLRQENIDLKSELRDYRAPLLIKDARFKGKKNTNHYFSIFGGRYEIELGNIHERDSSYFEFVIAFRKHTYLSDESGFDESKDSLCFKGTCVLNEMVNFTVDGKEYFFAFTSCARDTGETYSGELNIFRIRN